MWRPCLDFSPPEVLQCPFPRAPSHAMESFLVQNHQEQTASILPRCWTFQRKAKKSVFMSFHPSPMGVINFQINHEAQLSLETSTENSSPFSPTPYLCSWILNSWETSVHCRCDPSSSVTNSNCMCRVYIDLSPHRQERVFLCRRRWLRNLNIFLVESSQKNI